MVTELEKQISSSDNPIYEVDIWNETNFRLGLTLINPTTNAQEDFTGFFPTGADTLIETYLITNSNDSLRFQFTLSGRNPYNNAYNAKIIMRSGGRVLSSKQLILTVLCDTVSTIHAWGEDFSFIHNPSVTNSMEGNSQSTVNGFGAYTDVVISVGSYVTRLGYTTYDGIYHSPSDTVLGGVSYFSSKGPSRDGRVKPDICAPGEITVAPYNRSVGTSLGYVIYDTIHWNGQIENYVTLTGTSMSSPVMTGVAALWMQNNPSLRTDSLREIVHNTARNDQFTGQLAINPSNVWGSGKVNAFGGLPAPDTALWLVNAFGVRDGFGYVSGGGVVTEGLHTLTAVPNNMYYFVNWSDGVTDNPRTVNVTCDTTFVAVFEASLYDDCDTIRDYPWTAEFDENFTCWKQIDADGDGKCWQKRPNSVSSMAYGVVNLDNWLVSAPMEINSPLVAKVSLHGLGSTGTQDCSLLLSTSGSETSDFNTVLATHTSTGSEDFELTAPLNEYQGQVVRLAVRHHNIVGMAVMMSLNDFVVELDTTISVPTHEREDYTVTTNGLQLSIRGAENNSLQIYDMMGRLLVNRCSADGAYQMPAPGVYILRVDGFKPRKVMVVG